jgi:hypothetical protein
VFVDPLQEAVGFHLAQVITELGEGVVLGREGKGRAHDLRWRVKHPDSSGQCAQLRRSEEALLLPVSAHRPTPAQTLDASEDARITAKGRPTEPETEQGATPFGTGSLARGEMAPRHSRRGRLQLVLASCSERRVPRLLWNLAADPQNGPCGDGFKYAMFSQVLIIIIYSGRYQGKVYKAVIPLYAGGTYVW